jgi:hypothetical protein
MTAAVSSNPIGYTDPIRSAKFSTGVTEIMTRFAPRASPSRWTVAGGIPGGVARLYRRTTAGRRRLPVSAALTVKVPACAPGGPSSCIVSQLAFSYPKEGFQSRRARAQEKSRWSDLLTRRCAHCPRILRWGRRLLEAQQWPASAPASGGAAAQGRWRRPDAP